MGAMGAMGGMGGMLSGMGMGMGNGNNGGGLTPFAIPFDSVGMVRAHVRTHARTHARTHTHTHAHTCVRAHTCPRTRHNHATTTALCRRPHSRCTTAAAAAT